MSTILTQLNWRIATKIFDPHKKLSDETVHTLLEAARLSPSSLGIQPWKFVVVKTPELRQKLRAAAWNQPQITDASHLVVLCSLVDLTPDYVDKYINFTASERGVDAATLADYKKMILGTATKQTPDQLREWMARQVYIALGVVLSSAAALGVDACPMEGFDPAAFNTILNLEKYGVEARVVCALGYRSADDWLSKVKKVRFPWNEVVVEL